MRLQRLGLEVGRPQRRARSSASRASARRASRSPEPCAASASRSSRAPYSTHSGSPSSARRARRSHPPAMAGRALKQWCSYSHTAHWPARHAVAELLVARVGRLAGLDAVVEPAEPPRRLGQQVEPVGLGPAVARRRRPARRRVPRPSAQRSSAAAPRSTPSAPAVGSVLRQVGHCTTPRRYAATTVRPGTVSRRRAAAARCSSTGWISAAGLNSMNVTPSSVQPVWPPGQ